MPTIYIDKKNQINYSVDYEQLLIDSIAIAKNPFKKLTSIKNLIEQLKQLDKKNTIYFQPGKNFYYGFKLGSNILYLNFNIAVILGIVTNFNYNINTFSLTDFGTEENSKIIYSREIYENNHILSIEPILLCPFKLNGSEYLVIDGNHRVTAKVDNKIDRINCYIYDPNLETCLSSLYDVILYKLIKLIHL